MPKIKIVSLPKHQVAGTVLPTKLGLSNCGEGYIQDEFGNCNPDPNYVFLNTQAQQSPLSDLMTQEQMQEEAERIWMGQGVGSKGQPIVGTTNQQGQTVGGVGAEILFTTTTTKAPKSNFLQKVSNIADTTAGVIGFGAALAKHFVEKPDMQRWLESQKRKQMFTGMTTSTNRGNIETNTGKQAPNLGGQNLSFYGMYGKYGGEFDGSSKKIMIDEVPDYVKMAYGGQTKYGLNIARTDGPYGAKPVPHAPDHVTNSVSETKTNEPKKLEAEKGEYLWKVGDGTIHYIDGKKHYEGGTKLTSSQVDSSEKPEVSSFIFSDHLKLPSELVKTDFNYETSKRKVSPAEVAGKYELNKYQAILDSKNSDKLDKTTAQLMVDKNTKQLAKLAVIHEAIKGEQPPQFAMEMLGEVPTAKLGGYIQDKYLPHFQTRGVVPPGGQTIDLGTVLGGYSRDYSSLEQTLKSDENKELRSELFKDFKTKNPSAKINEDEYINNFLEAQKQFYAINNAYADNPEYLRSKDWDRTAKGMKNKLYSENAKKLGFTPLKSDQIKFFQQAYRDLAKLSKEKRFQESFGKRFKINPVGVSDQTMEGLPISDVDDIVGNTTIGQLVQAQQETPLKVKLPEESEKPKDKGPALKYTPVDVKQQLPPFDFTTPAKMKMIAAGAFPPIYEPPINPFIAGKQQRFWFNDWQAAAQQAQATGYRAPMETLTAYAAPQGLGSMASRLAGQTADLIGTQIVPQTGQANVAIANQAEAANAQEARRVELFNTAQKEDQRRETAIVNQQYYNSLQDFVNNMVDTYGLAWTERGDLYDTNMLTNYYKDPRSGRTIFKGQPANIFGAGYSYPGSSSGSYASLYKQNLSDLEGTDLTPEERKKEAMWMTRRLFGDDSDDYETTTKKRKKKTT